MNSNPNLGENTTIKAYLPDDITYLTNEERFIFLIVFALLLTISVSGNVSAIFVTTQRNNRFIQKCCIISLAMSDLIMTASYCTNNMETFSHPMINWTLGEFMCSFIPMAQIFGLVVNLSTMVVIAMDRYLNVVKTLTHRWNPTPSRCIYGFSIIWILCLGISYPIYPMFESKPLPVYHVVPEGAHLEYYQFCVTVVKEDLQMYYISIAALVFSSLWGCMLFLNCSIAHLIWSHRKPVVGTSIHVEPSVYSIETSSTQLSGPGPLPGNGKLGTKMRIHERGRNPHVAQRLRTFKVVIFLMLVFTACRLPFWMFNIIKLSFVNSEKCHWLMLYGFNALALLNCSINPFLYTFLQPTLRVLGRLGRFIEDYIKKICFWYCNATEFDEFGKENPFCTEMKRSDVEKKFISK